MNLYTITAQIVEVTGRKIVRRHLEGGNREDVQKKFKKYCEKLQWTIEEIISIIEVTK